MSHILMNDGSKPDRVVIVDQSGKGDYSDLMVAYKDSMQLGDEVKTLILVRAGSYPMSEPLELRSNVNVRGEKEEKAQ